MKKALSLFLTLILLAGVMCAPALADEKQSITVCIAGAAAPRLPCSR